MKDSRLLAAARLTLFVFTTLLLLTAYIVCAGPMQRARRPIQTLWSQLICWICGLRVHVIGQYHGAGSTLYVCNHVSYLDIPVLSRRIEATFVAKSEVANWPLFGFMAKVSGTVFVKRSASQARVQREELDQRLCDGGSLLLFPEGTSTDGSGVAPFKSALLDVVVNGKAKSERGGLVVQPVSVAYTRSRDGTPLTGHRTSFYCWYGDMTLAPHLWRLLGKPGAEVEIRFHQPVNPEDFSNRKQLAIHCHGLVAAGVAASHGAGPPTPR